MPLYINARCKQILNLLLAQSDSISSNDLARMLKISRRTLYYDLDKINLWLQQSGLSPLENVREKGLFISHSVRQRIEQLLESGPKQQAYIFTPLERAKCMIIYIIYASERIYVEQLVECFEVSRNTILMDLKTAAKILENHNLTLKYQPKTGYSIEGDTIQIRALFAQCFNEQRSLFTSGVLPFFRKDQIQEYLERLERIQEELGIRYVDGVLLEIAALVPLSYRHRVTVSFKGLREENIVKTRAFHLVAQYFPDLPREEQIYVSLHLLGSRANIVPEEFFESPSKDFVHDLVESLISAFEKAACVTFHDREALERALFVHLNMSLYRYRFGIQIGNELGDDILKEYPELFAITRTAAKHLEKEIGMTIPDSEIAYLVLHFGSFLQVSDEKSSRLRILIVCANGISTGNMIKREVQKLVPFAEIVDVVSAVNLVNAQEVCDLIISSLKINTVVPVITVHPILTEFDRRAILNHRFVAPKNVEVQQERLFRLVKKYVDPARYDDLLQDLHAYISGNANLSEEDGGEEYGLTNVLDAARILFFDKPCSWRQSIRATGQVLMELGSIERKYVDAIIKQLQYYGPYMFLSDDVILAHAKPEDGVSCLDLSMGIYREPVAFSETRKARLILLLAAVDQEKHLKILQDILTFLSQADAVERLIQCETAVEALQLISQLTAEF